MTIRYPFRSASLVAACALAFASVGACAFAGPYNPDNLPADQVAGISSICRTVMRLQPGEEHFQDCLESLTASAADLDRGGAMQAARGDCIRRGLTPESPGFGECQLRAADSEPVRATAAWTTGAGGADDPGGSKSYAYASPHDVFRREQLSCARLGFDPAEGGFASCVASLQSAMFEADHPAQ